MLAFWYCGPTWSVQPQLNKFAYRLGFLGVPELSRDPLYYCPEKDSSWMISISPDGLALLVDWFNVALRLCSHFVLASLSAAGEAVRIFKLRYDTDSTVLRSIGCMDLSTVASAWGQMGKSKLDHGPGNVLRKCYDKRRQTAFPKLRIALHMRLMEWWSRCLRLNTANLEGFQTRDSLLC